MLVSFLSGGEIWGYLRNMGNFSPIPEAVWLLIYMSLCNPVMLFPHCVAGCWVPLFWPVVLTAWTVCAQVSCHSATLVLPLFTQVIILWMEPLCVPQGQVSFFGDSEADLITATQRTFLPSVNLSEYSLVTSQSYHCAAYFLFKCVLL